MDGMPFRIGGQKKKNVSYFVSYDKLILFVVVRRTNRCCVSAQGYGGDVTANVYFSMDEDELHHNR